MQRKRACDLLMLNKINKTWENKIRFQQGLKHRESGLVDIPTRAEESQVPAISYTIPSQKRNVSIIDRNRPGFSSFLRFGWGGSQARCWRFTMRPGRFAVLHTT